MGRCQSKYDASFQETSIVPTDTGTPMNSSGSGHSRRHQSDQNQIQNQNRAHTQLDIDLIPSHNASNDRYSKISKGNNDLQRNSSKTRQHETEAQSRLSQNSPNKYNDPKTSKSQNKPKSSFRMKRSKGKRNKNKNNESSFPQGNFLQHRLPINNYNSHSTISQEWERLCNYHLHKLVPPIDVTTAIEERISSILNQLDPTQLLRIQRRVRQIHSQMKNSGTGNTVDNLVETKNLSSTSTSASGGGLQENFDGASTFQSPINKSIPAIASVSSTAKEKSKGLLLKDKLIDETIFRSIFVGGDGILQRGWESNRSWLNRQARRHYDDRNNNLNQRGHDTHHNDQKAIENDNDKNEEWDRVKKFLIRSNERNTRNGSNTSPERRVNGWLRGNLNNEDSTYPSSPSIKNKKNRKQDNKPQTAQVSSQKWELTDPLGSTFILLCALSENRWSHVAKAAAREIDDAGLQVDDTGIILDRMPKMINPVIEGTNDMVSGISFSYVCLLMAITIHGTREQKLLLLFHILLPPKQLQYLLYKHTFPTWILEESSDIIISLSSIYYYCDTSKKASLLNVQVCDTIAILLCAMGAQQDLSNIPSYQTNVSPNNAQSNTHTTDNQSFKFSKHHNIESILASIRDGTFVEPFPHTTKFWNSLPGVFEYPPQFWTYTDFTAWANIALDDNVINIIFHRLFNTGILPAPSVEKCLVGHKWLRWQRYEKNFWEPEGVISRSMSEDRYVDNANNTKETKKSFISKLFNGNNLDSTSNNENSENADLKKNKTSVWGGLGGVDGRGGLGHGIMYIVEKRWWDTWRNYVEWDAQDQERTKSLDSALSRPSSISNELLVNHNSPHPLGSLGSYYPLRPNLRKDVDYSLVPPGVWDALYEMYGGGPPLPRLVLPYSSLDEQQLDAGDEIVLKVDNDESIEIKLSTNGSSNLNADQLLLPIPRSLEVADHPWILHCHLCDPSQPYRRGDNGAISIRVMALSTQPLWRVFSEMIERLPIQHHTRAFDSNGKGIVRLWKKNEQNNTSKSNITMSRFGPWSLLCKNRHAPVTIVRRNGSSFYTHSIEEWISYTDNATVENIGLSDHSHLMLEFALTSKDSTVVWPREAAAKAGRERRLADEDASFRQYLRGLDSNGNLLNPLPLLVGKLVDAMDSTGRWYHGEIKKIEIYNPTKNSTSEKRDNDKRGDDESSAESSNGRMIPGEIFRVRINFKKKPEYGEWINVSSDRLAIKGRCTSTSVRSLEGTVSSPSINSDTKGKSIAAMANANSSRKGSISSTSTTDTSDTNGPSSTSLCPFPGYGACGLNNLGNTCYANAALQCLAYLPLLRSYMLSNLFKLDLNKENPLGTGGRVLDEYADLLRMIWSAKYASKAPSKFKQQLGKANSQFSGNDQQDAQELLLAIMDSLHEDSNKVLKKPMVPPMEDEWVNNTPVPRVGREAWWRYLRRNKSVIVNTAMGQVMNRVTCPVCNHSSLNFDPFGVLSIPFPTVNEVVFQCILFRRGSSYNCPITLARRTKLPGDQERSINESPDSPPSNKFIFEKYVVPMSRLADIGDLKLRLQNLTGISMYQLKLCTTNSRSVKKGENFDMEETPEHLNSFAQVIPLPDKPGPCFQLAVQLKQFNSSSVIYAFENTLNPRPPSAVDDELDRVSITSDEESDDNMSDRLSSSSKWNRASAFRRLGNQFRSYGDSDECVLNDSNPVILSKLMSRNLWPKTASDFTIGLRVDANDQRKHWFPGSVVEIIDSDAEEQKHDRDGEGGVQVKIHFDNFASKWDEPYTIDDFRQGIVRPLYSHSVPKPKPIEFMVYHRRNNRRQKKNSEKLSYKFFGHPFVTECFNEWSTARAGAHILAQASRHLRNEVVTGELSATSIGELDDETLRGMAKMDIYNLIANESSVVINEIINILVESDRRYVMSILRLNEKDVRTKDGEKKPRRNRSVGSPGSSLRKKLAVLLPRLPFEIRVCESDAPLGNDQKENEKNEEIFFPFSLVRTIGNFLTAKSSIVLDWKDVSELYVRMLQKNRSSPPMSFSFPEYPILYQIPRIEIHQQSKDLLDEEADQKNSKPQSKASLQKTKNAPIHGGMQLGACLDEFCKELHAEGWACPECKMIREGRQRMTLWHLPDLLTFHIKRFNCSARWREKIGTRVNFPLTGLNMRKWCDPESPESQGVEESTVYDLIGVINHYGGMTGGHYVAACKATQCSVDGTEEVAHTFSGEGISAYEMEGETVQTGWRLGRNKEKDQTAVQSKFAAAAARAVSESSEPLWLQFDDDLVEPIPPENVVSETAYVLFYRRRRLSPANIARYTSLD